MKKVAILNDIHGNYLLLKKALNSLENEKVDDYIFCGDMITDGFENNEVLDLIKSKTNNVVAGNREVSLVNYDGSSWINLRQWQPMLYVHNNLSKENKKFISSLPIFKIIKIENKTICISHGSPYKDRDLVYSNSCELFNKLIEDFGCDIYLFAHTHRPFYIQYRGKYFINCGAVSLLATGQPLSTYGILTIDHEKVNYDYIEQSYSFEELKTYFLKSDYYRSCGQWSNLLIYMLRDGFNYNCEFIAYLNEYSKGNNQVNNEIWNEKFKEYMKIKKLKIL